MNHEDIIKYYENDEWEPSKDKSNWKKYKNIPDN